MKLILAPNDFLDKKVKRFDYTQLDPFSTAFNMSDIMIKNGGLGLAANQVELDAQIFVMKPVINKADISVLGVTTVINPRVAQISEEMFSEIEGCLSYPGIFLKISRPRKIAVEYDTLTQDGRSVIRVGQIYEDIDARIFLHEFDHLNSVQFIDRVSMLKRQMSLKKLSKNKQRK
jgi:peptide deformylase